MRSTITWIRVAILASVLAVVLLSLQACTSRGSQVDKQPPATQDVLSDPVLLELEQLQAPAGTDPKVFAELKAVFREMYLTKQSAPSKTVSAGLGTEVNDLSLSDLGGGNAALSWTYRHQGDYDQNSEVGAADIVPIAQYYGATPVSANWAQAQVADGDSNTEVGSADIVPIAQNFGSVVTGYRIESNPNAGDPSGWTLVTEVPFSRGLVPAGQAFLAFDELVTGYIVGVGYRVVPVVSGGSTQTYDEQENNDTIATANQLPAGGVAGFTGSSGSGAGYPGYDGDTEDIFRFTAASGDHLDIQLTLNSATGDLDLYLLNGSGDTLLDSRGTGDIEQIGANVTSGGTFHVAVIGYSGYSDYTLNLTITGGGGNQAPHAAITANPTTGVSPLLVNFDASGSTDPDGSIVKYEWDWEDDGTWDKDTGGTPTASRTYTTGSTWNATARVRVTDNGGLTDTATVGVTITSGGFVEPTPETFVDYSQPGDSAARKWLLNCYRPLPPWQDADRCFQSAIFAGWATEVLQLTNQQRAANSLPALTFDPHLELVAQAHGRDMALEQFFAHENLYGMNFDDRLDAVNRPPYTAGSNIAGENIYAGRALTPTDSPAEAIDWWMNSPGHRANILNPNVTHLGVGVYYHTGDPSGYYAYFVQVFANWAVDPSTHDWLEPAEVPGP